MPKKKKKDMRAYRGMICLESNDHLFNLNHLEVAYISECRDTNKDEMHYFVSLIFKSGREIDRPFKDRQSAENFIEDLMGYFSVSFEES